MPEALKIPRGGLRIVGATTDDRYLKTSATNLILAELTPAAVLADIVSGEDIVLSDNKFIRTGTSDGSDNESIGIAGGGALSNLRGSFVRVSGNEDGNTGKLFLTAGNVAGGIIRFSAGGSTAMEIDESQNVNIKAGDVFVESGFGVVVGHTAKVDFGATPEFQVLGTATPDSSMGFARFENNASGPDVRFLKSRGITIGANTIVQDGDTLGRFRFQGADGGDFNTTAAQISAEVDGTPALNNIPGRLIFTTRTDGGSLSEKMRLDNAGKLGIGTTAPQKNLHVSSSVPTIRLSDSDAATEKAVATLIEFYRGDNTTRVGFWGMASASNDIMVLSTDYADGIIELRTGSNVTALEINSSGNFDFKSNLVTGIAKLTVDDVVIDAQLIEARLSSQDITIRGGLDTGKVVTIGRDGDTVLGGATLRVVYPGTNEKIDFGKTTNRINEVHAVSFIPKSRVAWTLTGTPALDRTKVWSDASVTNAEFCSLISDLINAGVL